MSQLSDNALYQALVARLEDLTGEDVDIAGASNNRLLQYMLLLMNQLELGDGSGAGNGPPGKSAYELAQDEGFNGTLSEWLESLKGEDGEDATGGGAPSDAYSPSNKPRLSAVGTPDYIQLRQTSGAFNWRYWGATTPILAQALSYSKLTVPFRAANVIGGEQFAAVIVEKVGSSWIVRKRYTAVLVAAQAQVEFIDAIELAVGSSWAILVGFNDGGFGDGLNRLYEATAKANAPFDDTSIRTDNPLTMPIGTDSTASVSGGAQMFRAYDLTGVNEPKDVLGPADPNDYTRSGTTSLRPAGMPTGFAYFDTSLSRPVWFDGSGWRDSQGTAV